MTALPLDPLSRLAILNGTDKFGYHDYTPNYFALLADRRDLPLRMLEIGVGGYGDEDRGGESLAMWRDFFPQAQITGIDIQKKRLDLGPRVAIRQGSQIDAEFLAEVVAERGPFDVILDDGSHRNDHVIETFGILFPTLVPGGLYIAEDVQTAFHPRHGGSLELTQPNSVGFFAQMLDALADGAAAGEVEAIERFHNIVALHKAAPPAPAPEVLAHRAVRALRHATPRFAVDGEAASPAAGPLDLLVVRAADLTGPEAMAAMIARCAETAVIVVRGWPEDRALVRRLFAEVDHVEMRAHFAHAAPLPTAARILSLAACRDGLVLCLGDNSYPSNFAFDGAHPRVTAALAAMAGVLDDPAAHPRGLLMFADVVARHQDEARARPVLDRLAAAGCTERRFFQLLGQQLQKAGETGAAVTLFRQALAHFPDDPQFATNLSAGLQRQGDLDGAEAVLRAALAADPRGRGAVVALSQLRRRRGDLAEALALAEQAVNLFPPPMRPTRLRAVAALAVEAGDPAAERRAWERLVTLEPGAADAGAALARLADSASPVSPET